VTDYLHLNRANWDERAAVHAASPGYSIEALLADPGRLSDVVAFDAARLGDLHGLDVVHLQCHIGTDTLSLHRLGGRVTGVDFSPASIREGRTLAEAAGAPIDYVESDVYTAPEALGDRQFDVVYTGVGALCWLPDIRRWAQVVAALLRPGGRLHLREGHPMLWALDVPDETRAVRVSFPYFERAEPLVWDEDATYVETEHRFANTVTHEWNHGLGEIVTALLDEGLELTGLLEHDTVPWDALPGMMELVDVLPAAGGRPAVQEYRLVEDPERLAATYTLQAVTRR
jgi:SAM-dependent methyltransferase